MTSSAYLCSRINASKHFLSLSCNSVKRLCIQLVVTKNYIVFGLTVTSKKTWKSLTGFITDGNSKLVGNARLRQVRVHKNSCRVAASMQQSERDCHAPYSWELEDMGSYGPGWSPVVGDNTSQNLHSPWMYQSQGKLRAYPIWGSMMLYRGGGFVVDLGPDLQNSSR